MQNGTIKLKDLFNGDRIFNIPKYQRTYAWTDENLEYFLDDLVNQRGEKSYFLGTLLFHQKESRGEYEVIDVVDGQQRLTTIIIFMNVVINILSSKNSNKITKKTYRRYIYDDESYTLELENEDSSFLHNYIFEDNSTSNFETPSQKRLFDAKGYFIKELSNLDIKKIEHIYDVLISADVIVYLVDKISDATQIFELLNDRGRPLKKLEGIKSFLMYRIGCLDLKDNGEQSIDVIQNNFSSIYRIIERENIDEDDLLRYHTISFEKSKTDDYTTPQKFIKNKINKLFEKNSDDIKIKNKILNYVERLQKSFIIFSNIHNNNINCEKFNDLIMIGRVNPFYPLMMNIYKNNQKDLCEFINDLVKFTFKAMMIGLRNDNEGFYGYIRKKEDFTDLFKWIIDDNWWDINKRVDEVLTYRNFYEWVNKNIVKYILFSYENHLRQEKGYPLLTKENYFSTDKREKLSIEHITAKRVKNIEIEFDEDFNDDYLHALGNLVIDTTSSNSRKGNKKVEDKMSEFIKSPIMSQNEINNIQTNWNDIQEIKKFIDERNDKIIIFIKNNLM
jgi:uncharacterized protein with ParB-like and HNH nuclease domain